MSWLIAALNHRTAETEALVKHSHPTLLLDDSLTPQSHRDKSQLPSVMGPGHSALSCAERAAGVLTLVLTQVEVLSSGTAYRSARPFPDYSVQGPQRQYSSYCLGSAVPVLHEQTTMDVRFALVVSYKAYRQLAQRSTVMLAEALP